MHRTICDQLSSRFSDVLGEGLFYLESAGSLVIEITAERDELLLRLNDSKIEKETF